MSDTARVPICRAALPVAAAVLLGIGPSTARAQTAADGPGSLQERLEPATRAAVQAVIDSAALSDVPTGPLVAKALEGAAKRASGERIVTAVRSLAADLTVARHALGAEADEASLVAGAAALRAGASSTYLSEFREARATAAVAWPLAVLADLVTHGVPVDTAGSVLLALARTGATDAAFTAFEQQVVRDVAAGVPPGAAAVARAPRGWGHGAAPSTPGAPSRPTAPHGRPATPDVMRHR